MNASAEARIASRLERYRAFDRVNRPYLEWQLAAFRPYLGQRVLEVGCGVGSILELLAPRQRLFGVDIDAELLACTAERFRGRPGFDCARLDAGALEREQIERLRAERFDTLLSLNVLEHLRDDRAALDAFARILPTGATLGLLVPAHAWLYGPYDALDGHFRRYTRHALATAVRAAGFRPLQVRYFNALGALGWFVQYRLLRRTIHGEGHFGLMNRLVPLLAPLERACPPPCGLSVVVVARREPDA